jgi:hypothetical protein
VTTLSPETASIISILLEELKALRSEIAARSAAQGAVLALNITAIGAIAGLFSYVKDPRVFFLTPVISSILGAIYTDHAINIGKLGRFIRWHVKPRLADTLGVDRLLDYEVYASNFREPHWSRRHLLPLAIMSMFVWVPLLALLLPFLLPLSPEGHPLPVTFANLLVAAPGAVLLIYFLVLYVPVHYGGREDMTRRPTETVEVQASDYR